MVYGAKNLDLRLLEHASLEIDSAPRIVAIVFGNLLRNACAYTDEGTVFVAIAGNRVTIADSGVGIRKQDLRGVFTPYFNPQNARGNGIGLSLVKRITDRFEWRITIDSEPAQGTRVEVVMPDARVGPAPAQPAGRASVA